MENPKKGLKGLTAASVFRTIGLLEGASFLLLLGIAMPLKYMWGMPMATKVAGMAHGVLFLAYLAVAHALADRENWPAKKVALAYGAAVLPFGPILFDRKFLR